MARHANCPKCDAEIGDTYEAADWSVGVSAGYYCDACDLGVAEHEVGIDYPDDHTPISFATEPGEPRGTEMRKLSGRAGHPGWDEFCRIAKSWGYD